MDNRLQSDFIRDLIVNSIFHADTLIKKNLSCVTKDPEISESLRKTGNDKYSKCFSPESYAEVHEYYSKSIAFAPINSDNLARGYGNRSALLLRVHKYEECLSDLNNALYINKSDLTLKFKWLCRKVKCLSALGSSECRKVYEEVEGMSAKILKIDSKLIMDNMHTAKLAFETLPRLHKKKPQETPRHKTILQQVELQSIFDSVAVRYSDKFGRHMIATKDIRPGEIIFVEKPYVGCISNNKAHLYCSHCFAKTWASIPCDFCNWCMFCSQRCKDFAWMSYHDIECTVISYLISSEYDMTYPYQLTLRSLVIGVREAGSIAKFKTDLEFIDNRMTDLIKNGTVLSNGFKSIHSLWCPVSQDSVKILVHDTIVMLVLLCKYTKFFGQNNQFTEPMDLQLNHDVVFIGSAFLTLWKKNQSSYNTVHDAGSNCNRYCGSINCNLAECTKGACISPVSYFINHSCTPNVKRCVTEDYQVIIFALLPIPQGSQIFRSYHQPFFEIEKFGRQKKLSQYLRITCDCDACSGDWPTLRDLWQMPILYPKRYRQRFNEIESQLYDLYSKLVAPILVNCAKAQYNQEKIHEIASAIEKTHQVVQQPSVLLCELVISLSLIFNKLYCSKICT